MESSVRKELAQGLLKDLGSEENKRTRKALTKAKPQVLFLKNLNFINETIQALAKKGKIRGAITDYSTLEFSDEQVEQAKKIAEKYQDGYFKRQPRVPGGPRELENTIAGLYLKDSFPTVYKALKDREAFILSSFDQVGKCKQEIVDVFVKANKEQLKKVKRAVDRGHGAGDGLAVSGVQIAKGMNRVAETLGNDPEAIEEFNKDFENYLINEFDTADLGGITAEEMASLISITVTYKQVVDANGKVAASYVPFITFQDKYTNQITDRAREVLVKDVVEKFFKKIDANELASLSGSSTLKEKMIAQAIKPLISIKMKGSKVEVRIDKNIDPRKIKLKTKGKTKPASTKKRTKGRLSVLKGKTTKPEGKVKKATASNFSVATIMGSLNAKLPDKVAQNMGSPALENRTGTFASSPRIVGVQKTPQGFPSIGYTYKKEPYSVFETTSGSRFADAHRDPRVIIDKSIREICAEMAIGRLYTRRL